MVDFALANNSCLSVFGQSLTLTRMQTGVDLSFSGILESGLDPEDSIPGEGSINARCWTTSEQIVELPSQGDYVTTTTTIYEIVDLIQDAGLGVTLALRKNRDLL